MRIRRQLWQTAVYWGSPAADGLGGKTFADPVEIPVRWEERQELFVDAAGQEQRSRAVVYLVQDVALDGYLFLGTLAQLTEGEEADPQTLKEALPIRGFAKIPAVRGAAYLRTAWL